jgi:hypothetical protein
VQANSTEVAASTHTGPRAFQWEGRYLNLGSAEPGEVLVVTFPIPRRKTTETIGNASYTLYIKGNTVVQIDPPGRNGPLYDRRHFLAAEAPTRKLERFVPDESIPW